MGAGLVALCAGQTMYAMRKYTTGAGEALGPNAAERSWVDERVPGNVHVARLLVSMGATSYTQIWRATSFWNTSVQLDAYTAPADPLPVSLGNIPVRIAVAPVSGRLETFTPAGRPLPPSRIRYILVPVQGTNQLGLNGQVLADDPYLPLELMKLGAQPTADWSIVGTSSEAFLESDKPATATVYSGPLASGRRICASFALIAPPNFYGRWPYAVAADGRVVRRGSLGAQQTIDLTLPLRASRPGGTATVTVRVNGRVLYVNGLMVSARFANFTLAPCG